MRIRYGYPLGGLLAYLAAAPIAIQYPVQADFLRVDLALVLVPVARVRSLMGFSKKSGDFITSGLYYDQCTSLVTESNAQKPARKYSGNPWQLLREISS